MHVQNMKYEHCNDEHAENYEEYSSDEDEYNDEHSSDDDYVYVSESDEDEDKKEKRNKHFQYKRCISKTLSGKRCKRYNKNINLCNQHLKLSNKVNIIFSN